VGKGGLEPPRPKAHDPKSCSSANSDTSPEGKPTKLGAPVNKPNLVVNSSLIEDFIASRSTGTSGNTILFYQRCLSKAIGYELTSEGIRHFLNSLTCHNAKRNYYTAIRALVNWLIEVGRLKDKPRISPPKRSKRLLPSLTEAQVDAVIDAANLRDKALVALAFASSLRLSELARLRVEDIDWQRQVIKVIVKGNREALAVLDNRSAMLVKKHLHGRQQGSLFELKARGVQQAMANLSKKVGVHFSCHSFRRAFASHLRRQGMSIDHIMLLGHWQTLDMPLLYSKDIKFEDSLKLYREL